MNTLKKQPLILAMMIGLFAFSLDQAVKWWAVMEDLYIESSPISLVLVYNKGIAFSMLAGLEGWLKYCQILLVLGIALYFYKNIELFHTHFVPIGILFGAACSNILDRFVHGGVVDYIYWHYLFEFAIFNLADVMINIAVALLLYQSFIQKPHTAKG